MIFRLVICLLLLFPVSVRAQDDVIVRVYQTLNSDYINETDNAQITQKGLKSLEKLDTNLKIAVSGRKLYVYYGKKRVQSYDMPLPQDDIRIWADFSKKVINRAKEVSSQAELLDFEIPDRFAQAVFAGLDGYSHYYGEFSDNENQKPKIRRHYAVRMIDDIMLIKILDFQKGVAEKTLKAVEECSSCRGIILDLRGNHGGILDEAIKIADMFLDEGIIAYTDEKDNNAPKYFTATAEDITKNKPLVILVDGYSASAAEVLAAALSEQNRAILIGTKTFGKGTIQNVVKMGNGRAMTFTTAYFYTPAGNKIDKNGLNPAICTGKIKSADQLNEAECASEDRFNQEADVEVAVKYIKNEL